MKKYETFRNPPIVEAVVDVKVEFASPISPEAIEGYIETSKDKYPNKTLIRQISAGVSVSPEGIPQVVSPAHKNFGFQFSSTDGKRVAQARLDGLSLSLLKPYKNWDFLRDEYMSLWGSFKERLMPSKVARIGVRYINLLELPLPFDDFNEYIKTTPSIAPTLPQALAQFFMRLVLPIPNHKNTYAIIIQTIDASKSTQDKIALIFDIDVYYDGALDYRNGAALLEKIEELRSIKNNVFFESITEKTKELFR